MSGSTNAPEEALAHGLRCIVSAVLIHTGDVLQSMLALLLP